MRGIVEAGRIADALMSDLQGLGRQFRPHARETLLMSLELGESVEKVTKVAEAYLIPQGIEMPWGVWVRP